MWQLLFSMGVRNPWLEGTLLIRARVVVASHFVSPAECL